jgi:peptide-methionine (S)-S-oxide reductase
MPIVIEPSPPFHDKLPPDKLLSRFNVVSLLLFALAACAMLYWALPRTSGTSGGNPLNLTLPAPAAQVLALDTSKTTQPQTIVFAGGCFWGVQLVFQHTHGVLSAVSGYAGGQAGDASYALVSSGATNHAEAVQVRFDPQQITLAQLLHIYFSVVHDPTQLNRQHPDEGAQYRSAVFTDNDSQLQTTLAYVAQLEAAKVFAAKIVTQISPSKGFYPAES